MRILPFNLYILLPFLLIIPVIGFTQSFHDNAYRNIENKMYWQNRKPHAAYWQQDVAYKIKADINERTNIINANEELTYWNNSPDTLHFVYFHLYQNAFTKGSYLEELHKANNKPIRNRGQYGNLGLGTTIDNFKVNGEIVKTELDNTVMKVYLNKPLLPGNFILFTLQFKTYFDRGDYRRRMALYNSFGNKHFNGVHWYPRICVYDKKKGWDTDQHLNKELYGDFGLFDVELTFANNYVVEATGTLQNANEVYPNGLREKLDIKNFANKPWNETPSIIIPYDSSKRKTWHFIGINVHDFAFTADPSYRISETKWNGISCIALVTEPHASRWQTASMYVAKIIQTFSENFGMYEYPKMVAADANDGMEYPMLTLDGGAEPDFHGLFMHEIGHNWFYGMIGNNETYRAALDEGFTQFITSYGLEKIDGSLMISTKEKNKFKAKHHIPLGTKDRSVYNRYMNDAVRDIDKTLNTHSNDFHSALHHENGYSNVYHKTAAMLYNLQYVLGDELFLNAMKHYVAKWKIAHPYFEDFRESIIEYTHQDLNWFFDQWMETNKHIDYGILSIKKGLEPDEFKIKFKRYGQMQMPIDFTVSAKNKQQYNFTIPNTYFHKKSDHTQLPQWYGWDLLRPTYTAIVKIPSGIKLVQIDTTSRLADIDMMDNYKLPHVKLAPESRSVRFDNFINNSNSWKKYTLYWRPDVWWNSIDGIKAGLHFDGNYFNTLRKIYGTVWFNTRLLSQLQYRSFEGESWWQNVSPVDYTIRYETPLKQISNKINWGLSSRFIDGFAKHSAYASQNLNDKLQITIEITSLYRKADIKKDYLLFKEEWSSYAGENNANNRSKENSYLQLQLNHAFNKNTGYGFGKLTLRAPLSYNYAYIQGELVNEKTWNKFDFRSRGIIRFGTGNDIPFESALFMQGANPEEMMENKFNRSQGVVPLSAGGFATDAFSEWHSGGGLNMRGYNGYYAIDNDDEGNLYINYKGRSGAAMNLEIEFDKYLKFRPKYIRDYLHLDAYLFSDAGMMSRGKLNPSIIPELNPVKAWSKLRADAGIGFALTIKKFGALEKANPFIIRFDMPFFLSAPPAAQPDYIAFRWMLGVNRAF